MPHSRPFRPIATGLLALAAALVVVSGGFVSSIVAAEAKPAKKDSRVETQPKDASLSASVSPAEAKPGDIVTFSVTAKVNFGSHIYAYNKVQPDEGPRATQFDLFDPGGLIPQGDWTPERDPITKKEPAFPDIPFVSYYENEVTWSIKLKVPADAEPGKKSIFVQASYQICNEQTCSFPGRWTVKPATLNILGAGNQAKVDAEVVRAAAEAPPATETKPKKKDSREAAKPKEVTFTTTISPAEAKAGDKVTVTVTAKLTANNHIYKFAKEPAQVGPRNTEFDFFEKSGLVAEGDWTPERAPIKKHEPVFNEIPFLEFYENEISWKQVLVVPKDATPGKKTLKVQAGYQICNDKSCSFPGQWTLPAVELTVAPGTVIAAAPAPVAPVAADVSRVDAATAPTQNKSDVEKQAELGLIPFLLTCMAGGLGALVMPCVWPMVPITVNFFVKQGQKGKSTTGLAVVYSLSIIGVFTAVGVMFSVFFGAASLSKLANNFWVNVFVAGLFLAFGLSLLGLFEIRLPNFLLNASAQGEGKGGLVGVFFMAMTLTITSFTCTFPVVGGLLVLAAGGNYFYPVIGLATFAAVVALPFFLLALSPGMLSKVPKSGDWMNAVKVVGGLVEIGAAFKFINTAETAFVVASEAWFNAQTVLTIWVILALVCGIYLLGLFRTDHDHEAVRVGPIRILLGSLFLFLSLFLAPALFGRPPQSKIWSLVVGLLPGDAGNLTAKSVGLAAVGGEESKASSTDPKLAEREQKSFHGVAWGMSYEAAVEEGRKQNKPILIDFTGVNCANCRLMEQDVLPKADVVAVLKEFITVQLYTDIVQISSITQEQREALASANLDKALKLANSAANPNYVIISPDAEVLGVKGGAMSTTEFIAHLKAGLEKFKKGSKLAQN